MKASINNKSNTIFNYKKNKTITNTPTRKKKILFINSEKEKDKNMVEGNNITININQNTNYSINNVYSTIDNHSRKKKKMVIKIEKKIN